MASKRNFKLQVLAFLGTICIASQMSAQVSGTIFKDFNGNGIKENTASYAEPGLAGVSIIATNPSGTPLSVAYNGGGSITNSTGQYTVSGGTLGQIRLQVILPDNYTFASNGSSGGTTILFPTTATQNLAVNSPEDYWNNTANPIPKLAIPIYTNGSQTTGGGETRSAVLSFGNDQSGTSPSTAKVAEAQQIGAVWGTAFQKQQNRYFFSSFLKRHVAFGPKGIGGVYIADSNAGGYSVSGSFTLQGVTPANGGAAIDLGYVNRSDVNSWEDNFVESSVGNPNRDLDAFGKVGTMGFGDIDMDEANKKLYLINLNQKSIITVDVSAGTSSLNNASTTTLSTLTNAYNILSLPGVPSVTGGQLRPWGLKIYKGRGYLGIIADASQQGARTNFNTGSSPFFPNLKGYVLSFDIANISAGFKTELTIDMSYHDKADLSYSGFAWNGWILNAPFTGVNVGYYVYAQPILADIEFDETNGMTLGFMDRWGHQYGYFNYPAVSGAGNVVQAAAYGDILHACYNPITKSWTMEGTGGCPINTSNDPNNSYSGSGEYFNDPSGDGNKESGAGGLAKLMGTNQTINVVVDPFPNGAAPGSAYWASGGLYWFNQSTGERDQWLQLYSGGAATSFGKAHGLGDIEAALSPAPIEIGNRVWNDSDSDGIQDAGEAGIDGVTVLLYEGATQVASTTTANDGQYYFNDTNVTGKLKTNTNYEIRIAIAQSPLTGKTLTTTDSGSNDLIDSDGIISGTNVIKTLTTGNAGENNHSYDFGFITCNVIANAGADVTINCTTPSATLTATGGSTYLWSNGATTASITVSPTNTTTYTVTVSDSNGCKATDEVIVTADKTAPIFNTTKTDITCFGAGNGTITINASGGKSPYQYSINNGATYQNTNMFNNLIPATYQIVVRGANGCSTNCN